MFNRVKGGKRRGKEKKTVTHKIISPLNTHKYRVGRKKKKDAWANHIQVERFF